MKSHLIFWPAPILVSQHFYKDHKEIRIMADSKTKVETSTNIEPNSGTAGNRESQKVDAGKTGSERAAGVPAPQSGGPEQTGSTPSGGGAGTGGTGSTGSGTSGSKS